MDWIIELTMIMKVLLACLLGGIIGWEREIHGSAAGIRTYSSICLGACVFALVSQSIVGADPARIAAQVVTGIGFLGAGVIFREGINIAGLTTAATLWTTAAIGLALAFSLYIVASISAIIVFLLLFLPRIRWWAKLSARR